jgi:hypothetical protein
VFSNRKWYQTALALNLLGSLLLFYSFQATSSDFRLVSATSNSTIAGELKQYALCVNDYTLLETDSHHGVAIGSMGCPDWEHARPAAVVNIEHPRFVGIGFILMLSGFLLQYLSVPQPKTIASLRKELKEIKMAERLAKSSKNIPVEDI